MSDYILRYTSDSNSLSHHGKLGQRKGKITSFVGKYYVPKGTRKKMAAAKEAIKKERSQEVRADKAKRLEKIRSYSSDSYEGAILGQLRAMEAGSSSQKGSKKDSLFGKQAVKAPKLNPDYHGLTRHKKETLKKPSEESEKKKSKDQKKQAKQEKKQAKKEEEESAQEVRDEKRANWRDAVKNKTIDKVTEKFTDSESEKLKKKKIGDLTDDELEYLRKRTNSEKTLKNNLNELNKEKKPEKSSEDLVKAASGMKTAFDNINRDVQKNPPMKNPKPLKLSKYSDDELRSMISDAKKKTERARLEEEYNSLVNSPRVNTGAVRAAGALATVGTLAVVGTQVGNFIITAKKMSN